MHKTLKAFVEARHFDAADQIAQRALVVLDKLEGLVANAFERGDGEGHNDCQRACFYATGAFAIINEEKQYPFAGDLARKLGNVTIAGPIGNAIVEAGAILEAAEAAYEHYKDRCAPTYSMHGVKSVVILRGDHCLPALAGMVAHNDH